MHCSNPTSCPSCVSNFGDHSKCVDSELCIVNYCKICTHCKSYKIHIDDMMNAGDDYVSIIESYLDQHEFKEIVKKADAKKDGISREYYYLKVIHDIACKNMAKMN